MVEAVAAVEVGLEGDEEDEDEDGDDKDGGIVGGFLETVFVGMEMRGGGIFKMDGLRGNLRQVFEREVVCYYASDEEEENAVGDTIENTGEEDDGLSE